MDQRNFEYLQNQLKYTGFGENLTSQLQEHLRKGQANFTIRHQAQYGQNHMQADLHFSRSMQSELYFFNNYKAAITGRDGQKGPSQTFYIGREGANITFKEAYNLLDGRSVFKDMTTKEGRLYQAWLQLDFKQTTPNGNFKINQYGKNYGYDLLEALKRLPIKEMQVQDERIRLLDSLKRGNRHQVTLSSETGSPKVFVEANPQFKAVVLYDSSHNRIRQSPVKEIPSQAVPDLPAQTQAEKAQKTDHLQSEKRPVNKKRKGQSM